MLRKQKQKNKNSQSGFTILVAVVTAGILLIIAMSIGGIALKEQMLSTSSKESQIAYYAADTGMECALFQDQKMGAFGPASVTVDGKISPPPSKTIQCNNKSILLETTLLNNSYSYTFKIDGLRVENGATTCSVVSIKKSFDTSDIDHVGTNKTITNIKATGYNTCGPSLRRLERGIEANY